MTPRAELNQLIIVANNTLKHNNNPAILQLEKYSGYAIMLAYENEQLIKLSPRLSAKNLIIWLNGFIEGLDF
jgi:hypothetical protein